MSVNWKQRDRFIKETFMEETPGNAVSPEASPENGLQKMFTLSTLQYRCCFFLFIQIKVVRIVFLRQHASAQF